MVLVNDRESKHVPAPKVKAIDTVAAGDTFCGGLAVALVEGLDTEAAMRFAVTAASISVQRGGAAEHSVAD
ncbi:MAG: PfkB family carbohydrate kinase [Tepidisphaeraceae bacterium]